jgi:hypothetical protein
MADVRKREREKAEWNKAKVEEITFKSFGDMEFSWCVENRMHEWKETKEDAEKYCEGCRQEVRAMIATDMEDQAKREETTRVIEKINSEVSSQIQPFSEKVAQNFEDTVQYCIKRRTDIFKDVYSKEAIEQYCRDLLVKADSQLLASIIRQQMRDVGTYTVGDVSEEYADRVYTMQAILSIPQATAERHVKADMIQEGKFADLDKRTYSRESVGNLFGKTRKEILAETYPEQSHYGKDAKAREEFQKFEEELRASGVSMPSDHYRSPRPGRMTVGNLFGKTRKQILDMDKEEEQK